MFLKLKVLALSLALAISPALSQTLIPRRAAMPPGIPVTVDTPVLADNGVITFPLGPASFPFTLLKAFGFMNVTDQGTIRHYDPAALTLTSVTTVGTAPAVNLGGLAVIGNYLVASDYAPLASGGCGCVWWLDGFTHAIVATTPMGGQVRDLISDGSFIYASLDGNGIVKKIDPATKAVVLAATYSFTAPADGHMAWDGGNHIWVTKFSDDQIIQIDTSTMTQTTIQPSGASGPISTGRGPISIDIDGDFIWVGNEGRGVAGQGGFNVVDRLMGPTGYGSINYPMGANNAAHLIHRWRNQAFIPMANANGILRVNTETRRPEKWYSDGCNNAIDAAIDVENGNWWATCGGGAPVTPMIQVRKIEKLW